MMRKSLAIFVFVSLLVGMNSLVEAAATKKVNQKTSPQIKKWRQQLQKLADGAQFQPDGSPVPAGQLQLTDLANLLGFNGQCSVPSPTMCLPDEHAESQPVEGNGCGAVLSLDHGLINAFKDTTLKVALAFVVPYFTPACNTHDKCFSECGKSFNDCNTAIYSDMIAICQKISTGTAAAQLQSICAQYRIPAQECVYNAPVAYDTCINLSQLIYLAIQTKGCTPYKDAQNSGCLCKQKISPLPPPLPKDPSTGQVDPPVPVNGSDIANCAAASSPGATVTLQVAGATSVIDVCEALTCSDNCSGEGSTDCLTCSNDCSDTFGSAMNDCNQLQVDCNYNICNSVCGTLNDACAACTAGCSKQNQDCEVAATQKLCTCRNGCTKGCDTCSKKLAS